MNTPAPKVVDVARLAGVSTATVSRVLNDPDKVTEATRKAVMAAVEQTGYRINQAARSLRTNTTRTILALVPNISNPFFSNILSGLERGLSAAGYSLLVSDTGEGGLSAATLERVIAAGQADGLVILDGSISRADIEAVQRRHPSCPLVFACEWVEGFDGPSVRADNAAGIALLVDHLWDLGHRRFGHVTGPMDNILSHCRRAAFVQRLQDRGADLRPDWIIEGDFSIAAGAAAGKQVLALQDGPTAWICASDEIAFGLISKLTRCGVKVPDQISVAGFDNIEMTEVFTPPLTTVHQHRNKMGAEAARAMLDQLRKKRRDAATVMMPVYLVERGSTGPVAGLTDG